MKINDFQFADGCLQLTIDGFVSPVEAVAFVARIDAMANDSAPWTPPKAEATKAEAPKAESKTTNGAAKPAIDKDAVARAAAANPAKAPKAEVKKAKAEEPDEEPEEAPAAKPKTKAKAEPVEEDRVPAALVNARKLADVVTYLMEKLNITDPEEIKAYCEKVKESVPVLSRIANLDERIDRTLEVIAAGEAA